MTGLVRSALSSASFHYKTTLCWEDATTTGLSAWMTWRKEGMGHTKTFMQIDLVNLKTDKENTGVQWENGPCGWVSSYLAPLFGWLVETAYSTVFRAIGYAPSHIAPTERQIRTCACTHIHHKEIWNRARPRTHVSLSSPRHMHST